jgi:hypothetical protein
MLLGAAVFGRGPGRGRAALAAAAGGLTPDLAAFALVLWAAARGMDGQTIFREAYFSAPWQAVMAPFHSAPLWLALLVLSWSLGRPSATAFAGSALLHQAFDLPLHADDPHRHLWPLSDWRFHSPVSYWDPRHSGAWIQPLEIALGLGLVLVLWRRWPGRWSRVALALTGVLYVAQATATAAFLWF